MPFAVIALAISMFAIGTTEFVIVGLLPTLAAELGTRLSTAGILVTAYALGIALGGPIIIALTARIQRRSLLVGLMLLFVLGNVLCGAAPNFTVLLLARVLTAFTHASFVGVGVVVAMNVVDERHRGRAVATVFGGLTIALVVGVPLGTFLGQHFTWRTPFFAVAALGLIATIADLMLLPEVEPAPAVPLRHQLSLLADRRLLTALGVAALAFGGNILAYTYIAPFLEQISGFPEADVSWLLLGFGIAAAVGNFLAGPLADKSLTLSLWLGTGALSVTLLLMAFTGETRLGSLVTLLVWGGLGFGIAPILQTNSTSSAPRIPEIASALTVSAFNLGIAGGAFVGGRVVDGLGVRAVTWVGASIVASAALLAVYGSLTARRNDSVNSDDEFQKISQELGLES